MTQGPPQGVGTTGGRPVRNDAPTAPARQIYVTMDARLWGKTGIGRYIAEVCRHVRQLDGQINFRLLGAPPAAQPFGQIAPFSAGLYSIREQFLGSIAARKAGHFDLCHFPHYNVPICPPRPFVVTIHDLIHFKFPELFGRLSVKFAAAVLKRSVRLSARIITPSDSTRRDLLAMFPHARDKTVVVPNGVSDMFSPCSDQEVQAYCSQRGIGRYVLCMGDRKPYKRFAVALEAFRILKADHADLQLVCVGMDSVGQSAGMKDVIALGQVDDTQLRCLYSGAQCLLFPSAYEGFGLPVLEAMACNCPVVAGTGSSLDEVCAGAALQVDASSASAVAAAANRIMTEPAMRVDIAARGLAHSKQFPWSRTAAALAEIYRESSAT